MVAPSPIRPAPLGFYGLALVLAGLAALSASAFSSPGCTGPQSQQPCDYVQSFKHAATRQAGGYSTALPFQVLDLGSSVYVGQAAPAGAVTHTPGAVIDKKSCRVCRVDAVGAYLAEDGLRVLAVHSAERPRP